MTSSITFETALLADAIKKAAKIAPNSGAAFDKAAGIVFEFDPAAPVPLAVVRCTNLDIFCIQWVNVAEWSGERAQWRLPSAILAQVVASLPIGSDKTVTFTSEVSGHSFIVHMVSGKTKVKLYPMDVSYYPTWPAYDPDNMFPAPDLGGRIDQVEWAASSSEPRLAGVLLDGSHAIATDSYKLACSPLPIPNLESPVIVPAGLLGQVLRQTGEIQIGMGEQMLHIMPDEYTQIKTVLYNVEYPKVHRLIEREFTHSIDISRDRLMEMMTRVNAFAAGDRAAAFHIWIGSEQITIRMLNEQMGTIDDQLEIGGQATHDMFMLRFTPKNVMEALAKSPNDKVQIHYNAGDPKSFLCVDSGTGYRAWIVPRHKEQAE